MMNLAVRATEQAIQNEKTRADSQADAQVLAAKGQADFQRSLGQALLNLVFCSRCRSSIAFGFKICMGSAGTEAGSAACAS